MIYLIFWCMLVLSWVKWSCTKRFRSEGYVIVALSPTPPFKNCDLYFSCLYLKTTLLPIYFYQLLEIQPFFSKCFSLSFPLNVSTGAPIRKYLGNSGFIIHISFLSSFTSLCLFYVLWEFFKWTFHLTNIASALCRLL